MVKESELKGLTLKKSLSRQSESASEMIGKRVKELDDWRGRTLSRVRQLIKEADPEIVEEVRWRKPGNPGGIPVWYHDGLVCTGETYKNHVRLTFAKGASLKDPKGLFNASLEGNALRAIVIHDGDEIDDKAFKALVRSAVALNTSSSA
jgi:hypothetical protein